ncbi:hypothetical protein GWI33_016267 [Rhynchophorus ferrugineus]|uniref:Uncharacterized protein n=1 Tax=Rhynchophorus ferrugineus TaxID=354439 RepID=A0A834M3G9_RHYFE|nr:hypothetical protein GWI33_016267 [Rhynchophorus ferrugineus]
MIQLILIYDYKDCRPSSLKSDVLRRYQQNDIFENIRRVPRDRRRTGGHFFCRRIIRNKKIFGYNLHGTRTFERTASKWNVDLFPDLIPHLQKNIAAPITHS